jgi:tetratricopeptide (TPR) repeat protein
MKQATFTLAFSVLLAVLSGCGGGKVDVKTGGTPKEGPAGEKGAAPVAQQAAKGFKDALETMVAHDKANDWADATCASTAKAFLDASEVQKSEMKREFPEAVYNAGLAYQRCNKDAEAKTEFKAALAIDQKFHRARVQMALYDIKEKGDAALEPTIQQLMQAVQDAKFQNVEALVNLAALQMRRRATNSDQDGANDFERAKKNLQRALAIDDGFQPAFNQLAMYYFEIAKAKVGRGGRRRTATFSKSGKTDQQMLELAALVCSQAIRKNPNYAQIHNTAGLIQVELQNINSAVQEFQAAAKLDPAFFEAQMNYAAVNLSFRGFEEAEKAYKAALKIKPNDYDAHLGLALAIRGQINDSNWDQRIKEAHAELDQCKKVAPDRAETFYNEGILVQEFEAKGKPDNEVVGVYDKAIAIFQTFIQKAGGAAEFKDATKRSKDRVQDMGDIKKFIQQGLDLKAREAALKDKAAEAGEKEEGSDEGAPAEGATPESGGAPAPSESAPPAPQPEAPKP